MKLTEERFLNLVADRNYIKLHHFTLHNMKPREAVSLAFLLNDRDLNRKRIKEGWLILPKEKFRKYTGYTEDQQRETIRELVNLGLIEVKQNLYGMLGQRFIRMVYDKVLASFIPNNSLTGKSPNDASEAPSHSGKSPNDAGIKSRMSAGKSPNDYRGKSALKELEIKRTRDKTINPKTFSFLISEKLYQGICQNKGMTKLSGNVREWSEHIKELRSEGASKERIRNCVNFYLENISGKFMPSIFSGKDFKNKFLQLETQMNRDKPPPTDNIPLDKETRSFLKYYKEFGVHEWPKGGDSDLKRVLVQSWRNFQRLLKARKEWLRYMRTLKSRGNNEEYTFDRDVMRLELFSDVKETLIRWFEEQHERVSNWDDWNGNMDTLIFSMNHKLFRKWGTEFAEEHSGDGTIWDKYIAHFQ